MGHITKFAQVKLAKRINDSYTSLMGKANTQHVQKSAPVTVSVIQVFLCGARSAPDIQNFDIQIFNLHLVCVNV